MTTDTLAHTAYTPRGQASVHDSSRISRALLTRGLGRGVLLTARSLRAREMLRPSERAYCTPENRLERSDSSKWASALIWQSWPIPGPIRPSTASTGFQTASEIAYEYPPRTLSTTAGDLR